VVAADPPIVTSSVPPETVTRRLLTRTYSPPFVRHVVSRRGRRRRHAVFPVYSGSPQAKVIVGPVGQRRASQVAVVVFSTYAYVSRSWSDVPFRSIVVTVFDHP